MMYLLGQRMGLAIDGVAIMDADSPLFAVIELFDDGGTGLAHHLVLGTGAARAANRTDELAALQQRNPAARGDNAVERNSVVSLLQLNVVLEHPRFTAKAGCRTRLVLRHR